MVKSHLGIFLKKTENKVKIKLLLHNLDDLSVCFSVCKIIISQLFMAFRNRFCEVLKKKDGNEQTGPCPGNFRDYKIAIKC